MKKLMKKHPLGGHESAEMVLPAPGEKDELHRLILETAPDAIILVGKGGDLILHNKATEEMFGYSGAELEHLEVEDLLPGSMQASHRAYRTQYHRHPRTRRMGTDLDLRGRRKDGTEFPVDIMLSPLTVGNEVRVVAVIRDITERVLEKKALEETRQTLHTERAKVQTLTGLLPICAWCKNVRDDTGYWSRVEEYFHEHADIDFTHGICPDCARKFAERGTGRTATVPAGSSRKRPSKK